MSFYQQMGSILRKRSPRSFVGTLDADEEQHVLTLPGLTCHGLQRWSRGLDPPGIELTLPMKVATARPHFLGTTQVRGDRCWGDLSTGHHPTISHSACP